MQKNVLIVNNDAGISYLLKKILKLNKTKVVIKKSYEEVADAVNNQFFDLILTDALIDGNFMFQYIEELKSECPNSHIIVMSEMDQQTIKNSVNKLGVNDFVSLPFNPIEVKNRIENYLWAS